MEFKITPIISAYEEIYFANNQGHYIKSPQIRGFFLKFILSLVVTIIITVLSLNISYASFVAPPTMLLMLLMILFCVGQILTIIFFIGYVFKAYKIKLWKKQVNEFLRRLNSVSDHKIILTDSFLTIIEDETEQVINWSSIKNGSINDEYISLTAQDFFLIPAKCVNKNHYSELRKLISLKLKQSKSNA